MDQSLEIRNKKVVQIGEHIREGVIYDAFSILVSALYPCVVLVFCHARVF